MHIALVEDDSALNYAISLLLRRHLHDVKSFGSADGLIDALGDDSIDLFILDINLPDTDGLELLTILRPYFDSSDFIFISAYSDMQHIGKAFQLGCEDYLKKPFDVEELLLRVQKIEMRRHAGGEIQLDDDISFDLLNATLYASGEIVDLTMKEGKVLQILLGRRGSIVTFGQLCEEVWGAEVSNNTIAALIRRLRKKLPSGLINTVREKGYRID